MMCEEFTMSNYEFATPEQFVALQLILDWSVRQSSPILKQDTIMCGVSVRAHRQCRNIIQCLYVRGGVEVVAERIIAPPIMAPPMVIEQPRMMAPPVIVE